MRVALILVSFSLLLNASINENLVVVKPKSDIVGKNIQKAYANTSENVAKTGSKGKSFEMPSQRPTNQTQTVVEEDQYDYEDELLMSWMEHYDKQNSELVERVIIELDLMELIVMNQRVFLHKPALMIQAVVIQNHHIYKVSGLHVA
jgi:hypothetical protein